MKVKIKMQTREQPETTFHDPDAFRSVISSRALAQAGNKKGTMRKTATDGAQPVKI